GPHRAARLAGPVAVIADDQAMVRGGLRLILEAAGITVVGEADDGRTAIDLVTRLKPDVADGHPDARTGRDRGDPPAGAGPTGGEDPGADDVRGGRVRLRGAAGRRGRVPAEDGLSTPARRRGPGGGRRRGSARPGDHAKADRPLCRDRTARPSRAARPARPDRPGARGAHADGPRPVQRRDRPRALRRRGHREDPRGAGAGQTRPARPGPGRGLWVRARPGPPGCLSRPHRTNARSTAILAVGGSHSYLSEPETSRTQRSGDMPDTLWGCRAILTAWSGACHRR